MYASLLRISGPPRLPVPQANTERRKVAHNGEQWPVDAHDLQSLLLSVLMPPYPCPAEERVGAWGDGGKERVGAWGDGEKVGNWGSGRGMKMGLGDGDGIGWGMGMGLGGGDGIGGWGWGWGMGMGLGDGDMMVRSCASCHLTLSRFLSLPCLFPCLFPFHLSFPPPLVPTLSLHCNGCWVCMLPTAIQENPIVYRKHAMPSLPIRFPTLHPSSPLFPPLPPSSHHSLSPPLPPPSPPLHPPPPTSSLVHASVGSNEQYDFEQAMGAALHTKPFTFDPFLSANATAHMLALPFLHFHQIAIAGAASLEAFRAKNPGITFMTLQGAMERLEHSYVDVLKMDCEGCEEEFIMGLKRETDEFLEKRRAEGGALTKEEKAGKRRGRGNAKLVVNGGNLPFGQLLVEFH
ncbi:unnamed protein product [Closterium sp. NIES-65]|nr:unnamed protein product [Closterium sp. NIES-65]